MCNNVAEMIISSTDYLSEGHCERIVDLFYHISYAMLWVSGLDVKVFLLPRLVQQPKEKASSCSEILRRGLGVGKVQQTTLVALPNHL